MKQIISLLLVTATVLVSCKKGEATASAEMKTETSKELTTNANVSQKTASMKIEGMTCAMGCAKTIENKLAAIEGVQKATVDFDKKIATVAYDANQQSPESLAKVVEAVGDGKTYKVKDAKNI
jgi:periplasmic mercuric ion binding protein